MDFSQHTSAGSFSPPLEGQVEALFIANRGEIAVRIIRAARKNGIRSVAVYAPDDADSLHVSMADESFLLSGNTLAETYLNQEKLIELALKSGAAAIHPGYGFLAENAGFAQKVEDAGLIFIGPSPENIRLMGEKNRALEFVRSLGIPVLQSFRGTIEEILNHAPEMEFPVMVKASGGGGGKGMMICHSPEELPEALQNAERQAISYFGNNKLFVEKYLPRARHIEVQLLADHHGNVLHFYERECSVQRHFQKIIEEAPSPSVDGKLRLELTTAAVQIARSMNYRNAGTIEFLLDESGHFYFLEMNTRIQVEHPVTEMVTGIDLVSMQLSVAAGNPLELKQENIRVSGHAIEVRLCAEDAENQFLPSAGKLSLWRFPAREKFRLETFVTEGAIVSPRYDSLLAKLVTVAENRDAALRQMGEILGLTFISGVHTNLSFLSGLIESETVSRNEIYTRFVDENLDAINRQVQDKKSRIKRHKLVVAYLTVHFYQQEPSGNSVWNRIGFWRINSRFEVSVDGVAINCRVQPIANGFLFQVEQNDYTVSSIRKDKFFVELVINGENELFYCLDNERETRICKDGFEFLIRSNSIPEQALLFRNNSGREKIFENLIRADLFGRVLKIRVQAGDLVKSGEKMLTLESMKTEIHVLSPVEARVKKLHVKEGNTVVEKQLLIELQPPPTPPNGGGEKLADQL